MPRKRLFHDWDGGRNATIVPSTDDMQRVDMETVSERSLHSPALLIKYAFLATMERNCDISKVLSKFRRHHPPPARLEANEHHGTCEARMNPPRTDRFYVNSQKMDSGVLI